MVMNYGMWTVVGEYSSKEGIDRWFKSNFLGQLRLHKVDMWFMYILVK